MPTPRSKISLFGAQTKKKGRSATFFSGVGHGIKKPRSNKSLSPVEKKESPPKPKHVRQAMKEKFDFSRTPYATPKRPRVALNEENGKKRKFFKTTVAAPETKKPKMDKNLSIEFDEYQDKERENINKSVDNFLKEWDFESEHMGPKLTRQKANEHEPVLIKSHCSYLTSSSHRSSPIRNTADENTLSPITPTTKNIDENLPPLNSPITKNTNASPKTPLYPIFTTPKAKEVLIDVTNKKQKSKASLIKAAAPNDQYQIDAGQIQIGPVECSQCGMVYDVGDAVDERRHNTFHEKRFDLKYKTSKGEDIVGYCGTDHIILIKHSDEKKRKKIEEILKVTEDEIGSGYTFGPSSMTFIYVRNDRILGCLIAESIAKASPRMESNGIVMVSDEDRTVKCGVNRIWVKKSCRGKKIATEMINCLRRNFIYGDYLQIEEIAFSTTTADGHAFAKNYTGREDYLTYIDPGS